MADLLIKNGKCLDGNNLYQKNILVSKGKIIKLGKIEKPHEVIRQIDAGGKLIIPGGIDPHVHLHLPTPAGFSSDDFESGSRAAIAGGTTSLVDFVTPLRGQSMIDALHLRRREAEKSRCNVKFHVSPVEWTIKTEQEIIHCIQNEGIISFKVYMAYQSSVGLKDEDIFKVMRVVGKYGGLVTIHCELDETIERLRARFIADGKTTPKYHPLSRPNIVEAEAVKKATDLAEKAECPLYIVHVSARESLDHIHKAQSKGQPVYAETCPQYLLLDDRVYDQAFNKACAYMMSPPLRTKEDSEALWQAIHDDIIQTVGTDHCPFALQQKRKGLSDFTKIPNGAGGVEHRMSLLYTYGVLQDRISLKKFIEITSFNPANIFGWTNNKGEIKPGKDADLVIWDPEAKDTISVQTHHQNCDLNIYEGFEITGKPQMTIVNGIVKWNTDDAD